ncbi:uncharacterized protein K460DRAFT_67023 [Cucurbitaria berberidis CBS 394.84]|uniref:Uncharacterized protein n=1 Tax=Cucurbitaria berberidis CBS 394.84 TaxID=1168544 RepID=A0A9P4LB49_9PLEO|nr:uncharacterized protein K460DRAFT_67023 [Cucurbitaria berberidis CBS 394.84]KAF1848017.1 hypothetical protein K460DRAFT_67023 [Cucurbitaria berberidis CBS 394.84]
MDEGECLSCRSKEAAFPSSSVEPRRPITQPSTSSSSKHNAKDWSQHIYVIHQSLTIHVLILSLLLVQLFSLVCLLIGKDVRLSIRPLC